MTPAVPWASLGGLRTAGSGEQTCAGGGPRDRGTSGLGLSRTQRGSEEQACPSALCVWRLLRTCVAGVRHVLFQGALAPAPRGRRLWQQWHDKQCWGVQVPPSNGEEEPASAGNFFPLPVASNFSNCIRDHALHGVPVFESHGAPRASCPHRGFDEQPRGLFTRGPPGPPLSPLPHTHTSSRKTTAHGFGGGPDAGRRARLLAAGELSFSMTQRGPRHSRDEAPKPASLLRSPQELGAMPSLHRH